MLVLELSNRGALWDLPASPSLDDFFFFLLSPLQPTVRLVAVDLWSLGTFPRPASGAGASQPADRVPTCGQGSLGRGPMTPGGRQSGSPPGCRRISSLL